ncbi:MAG: replicative DNA helicase [Alphaproteobacteria bacterium]|nr:replicative DNA helicase [Alphaproteobacteria bacterium]
MATPENSDKITPIREPADGEPAYRSPPHNFEAEMGLLGAILANNRAYERVSEFLQSKHFADRTHGRIYEAAGKLIENGQIADPVTLRNYLEHDGALADIGGAEYLNRLAASVVTFINAEDYGRAIFDRYLRRELINLGEDVANRAYDFRFEQSALDQIEIAEQNLYDLATTGDMEGGFQSFGHALKLAIDVATEAYKRDSHVTGVASGFAEIDRMLGGLHRSELVILAGRPSMGKTALATNIAFSAARAYRERRNDAGETEVEDGAVVGFFSLEMSAEELATRILGEVSGVSSHNIRRGEIGKDAFPEFVKASQTLSSIPLFIDDTPALSISALRTRARRLKRQHGLSMIVIDYLQLMRPGHDSRPENRVQEISEITRGLKAIAKELDVPVLALSQLSRAVEQRDDKRPMLADLRESGSIEQDADVVMFIFREEYYKHRQEPAAGTDKHFEWQAEMEKIHNIAEVIIAKQRHGPVGTVKLYFKPELTKFEDLADPEKLPETTF